MSLRLKYLASLNLVIVLMWIVHTWGSMATLEDSFLAAEAEATEHLAFGLKLHLEAMLAHGEDVGLAQPQLEELSRRWEKLDLMVIDDQFRVRAASDSARVGKVWHEDGIESVLTGSETVAWSVEDHAHEGRRAIDVSVGVTDVDGEVRYVVHTAKWLDRLYEAVHRQRRHDLMSALEELLAVAVAVNLLTFWLVLRPLHRIRRRIAASGWLDDHPRVVERDEIRHLGAVVSSMLDQVQTRTERLRSTLGEKETALEEMSAVRDHLADRVQRVSGALADTQKRLIRAERLAALGQLSGALAHELRNPLHIVRATAETAITRCPDVADLATDIKEEVDRINRLISKLLDYTGPVDFQRHRVDVRELLESVLQRLCRGLCGREPQDCILCRISVDEEASTVDGDPVLLEQAVMNLVANAREMSAEEGEVELSATADGAGGVVVTVADRGPGIPDEERSRVFEPFFTRKADGTGLGLPVVQKIADLHGGSITLAPREGGGTVARLHLPAGTFRGGQ